ncbi:hypothetical protein KKH23_09890 [Patescibacteria group bacterium]|nr:hypothetical protein [Patescibacteria group bacterium]
MTALSYMIAILFTWMLASHQGYVYFQVGEPNVIIMYLEWALGIVGIVTLADICKREID